jgi:hypothetical protein
MLWIVSQVLDANHSQYPSQHEAQMVVSAKARAVL